MALFKILRGDSSRLNSAPLNDGFAYFTPDDGRFYIDVALSSKPLNVSVVKEGTVSGQTIYRIELRPSFANAAETITDTYIANLSFNSSTGVLTITNGDNQTSTINIPIPPTIQIQS